RRALADWHRQAVETAANVRPAPRMRQSGVATGSVFIFLGLAFLFSMNIAPHVPGFRKVYRLADRLEQGAETPVWTWQKEVPPAYVLTWGDLELDLKKVAAPNGFSAQKEVSWHDIQRNFAHPLVLRKNGAPLPLLSLDLQLEKSGSGQTWWFPNQSPDHIELVSAHDPTRSTQPEPGDKIFFHGNAKEIFLNRVEIKIRDIFEQYEPAIVVPGIDRTRPDFGFQIITRADKKTIVRTDTLCPEAKQILPLYKDPEKYDIRHIPGFATNRRLVGPGDMLFPEVPDIVLLERPAPHYFNLPDFRDFGDHYIHLKWGTLIADPQSTLIPIDTFKAQKMVAPDLLVGKDTLKIARFRVIFANPDKMPVAYVLTPEQFDMLREDRDELPPKSSVYFEKIVVEQAGQQYHFPFAFQFDIGTNQGFYRLEIAESSPDSAQTRTRTTDGLSFRNYPLSQLIRILTGNEYLVFDSDTDEPRLDAFFHSTTLPVKKGERRLLKKLRRQFDYPTEWRYENRQVWVLHPPVDSTSFYHADQTEDPTARLAQISETPQPAFPEITDVNDLAQQMEVRFGIIVQNETGMESLPPASLNWHNFDDLRRQIERVYGITMSREERPVRIFRVRKN
ncbi:MAG: hypothetical protein D6714_20215, partial [Bacteroidetes bacterium]